MLVPQILACACPEQELDEFRPSLAFEDCAKQRRIAGKVLRSHRAVQGSPAISILRRSVRSGSQQLGNRSMRAWCTA